jgi:hypothetical protein
MTGPLFGVGYRTPHADAIARAAGAVDWFEVLSDNYLGVGGPRLRALERLRAERPVALHGVGLSIGGSEALEGGYLAALRALAACLDPAFVSDHLCWTALGGSQSHDLLPLAYTRAVLRHVAARVQRVQDVLGRRILLENPSAYVAFRHSEMDEADFLAELCRETGCGVLLDVNNLVVNAANLGADPAAWLAALHEDSVGYMHLAGHAVLPDVRIDTHDAEVAGAVWELFEAAVRRFPQASVIIERDAGLPAYADLVAEAEQARARHRAALAQPPAAPSGPEPGAAREKAGEAPSWDVLQREFWARLVDKPVGFEHRDLGGLLAEDRPVAAARGMRVYSDAWAASLREALATNFAALVRVISPPDFDRLAAAYLHAHPPRGHGFQGLGAHLEAFVRSHAFAHDYGVPREVLAELVALEQAQLEVQDAPGATAPVPVEALAAVDPEAWEGARFAFAPALRVLRASHDVAPVVEAVARGKDPERPQPGEIAYLVYRTRAGPPPGDAAPQAGAEAQAGGVAGGVRTESLSPREAGLLEALLAGERFGAACGHDPRAGEEGARLLVLAASHDLLVRLDLRGGG